MAEEKLLPLALLYVDRSREIDGATRFQKLVFLAQNEVDGLGSPFQFQPYKYGPFSADLYATLDELEERGLVESVTGQTFGGNDKRQYRLTAEGQRQVKQLAEDNEAFSRVLDRAQKIKREYNDIPLDRLLKYVYSKYPNYTDKSELDEFKPA